MQPQWTVEADGDGAPLTVTMQVAQVTVATENGDQITLNPSRWRRWCTGWTASTTT